MMWWADGGGLWAWLVMTLVMLAVVGIAAWAIITAGRNAGGGTRSTGREPARDPERILRERYAAGEIDDEEYERRLARLRRD